MCALVTGVQTCALPIFEHRPGIVERVLPFQPSVDLQHLGKLVADSHVRGEPGDRILKHQRDAVAAQPVERATGHADQFLTLEQRRSADDAIVRQQAEKAEHRLALARARFADDAEAAARLDLKADALRSEEHTSELQSLMRISYAVFCLKKKKKNRN